MVYALNPTQVDRAYYLQVERDLFHEWWYERGWRVQLPKMLLWYSTAGLAFLSGDTADKYLEDVKHGRLLPIRRRPTWEGAQRLAKHICVDLGTNPIDWFTGGCGALEVGWRALDDIYGIGPKIASFVLRDLSLLRDYSRGLSGQTVVYRHRINRRWFDALPAEDQAVFLPIDKYVHAGAKECGVSYLFTTHTANTIQSDPALHRRAAAAIVSWSRRRGYDPRDVNIYWYAKGQGSLD